MRGIGNLTLICIPAAALVAVAGISACGAQAENHSPVARPAAESTGQLPSRSSSTAAALLTYVALTDPSRGYGLFQRQAGSRCDALSGRTTDGGARFGPALAITTWNCNYLAPLTAMAADGLGDVLAYGPKLFILSHGSTGWRSSPQPGAVLAVSASGRSVWMVLADCRSAAHNGGHSALRLRESSDGGRSWQPSRAQPAGASLRGTTAGPFDEPALGQTWLLRTGLRTAYLATYPEVNQRGRPDSVPLWYTSNGGATWSRRKLPCGIDAMSAAAGFAPGHVLAAVCAGQPSAGTQMKTAAFSVNGGRTWDVHTTCIKDGVPSCQDPLFSGYLGQVAALSSRTAYLIGGRGALLLTTDGGRQWRRVGALGDDAGTTPHVMFFGRRDGVVVGDSATTGAPEIWHTADGGSRWTAMIPRLT